MNGKSTVIQHYSGNSKMLTSLMKSSEGVKNKFIFALIALCGVSHSVFADQVTNDDIVIVGSLCVGVDCVNGENFNFDTIRLKENNVRIRFIDTSTSSSFPTQDWQLTANESANGGLNKFSLESIDNSLVPLTVVYGAPNHSIYVRDNGYIGFNTSAPIINLHSVQGNTPTLRLEQDTSNGFAAQAWDVGGNETNFFIRDFTGGGKLPLRIASGAPNSSIHVAADGDVGFETTTPDGQFDIAHVSDANNHAVLVSPLSYFGVNIDNGFAPLGWFDVHTSGGSSKFLVNTSGNVGIGAGTSGAINGRFEVKSLDANSTYFNVDASGDIGIGTSAPAGRFVVASTDATKKYLSVDATGRVIIGSETFSGYFGIGPQLDIQSHDNTKHTMLGLTSPTDQLSASFAFKSGTVDKWTLRSVASFNIGSDASTADRMAMFNASGQETFTWHQNGSVFIGTGGGNNNTSHSLAAASGAHLTTGGVWTNSSSRERKEHIEQISTEDAVYALEQLTPVTFNYKVEPEETYAGFIAEEVPEIVANNDRKSLSSMDVVAVLTQVVKDQHKQMQYLKKSVEKMSNQLAELKQN